MKLDQIPKKNVFNAPEGYFDKLPGIIQSRIEAEKPARHSFNFGFALRYALPAVVLIAAGIFWFRSGSTDAVNIETELASIDVSALEVYLEGADINADELIEIDNFKVEDLQELEDAVYSSYDLSDTDMNELLNVYEVEPVKDSVQ